MGKYYPAIFLTVFFVFVSFGIGQAKEVTVEGGGIDRESALRDARRVAVEEVCGTFVDSRTLTKNSIVEVDEIYLKTHGFIGKVTILNEGVVEGIYKIRATINVDENPSSELLQQVQAVVALNDPRIAVAVLKENSTVHEDAIESAIIDKLISQNFTHILDSQNVSGLQNIQILNNFYNGQVGANVGSTFGADYIVLGKCFTKSNEVKIPDFKGGYIDTGFHRATTEMVTKIIKLDTGDILETFTVGTSGIEVGNDKAEYESLKNMAEQASAKVEEKFRKIGAKFYN